ncbi:protein IQ-DOMAIN 1 [Vigna radiata var. radiata]|uniref:Protein IQ-DOMAIN 1 n=1 Tax=Vigna radiata var. radiata TaxID=3916 RepID=A0A1S3UZF9_VIGRR|nr:protein IQ-DOMAIN 1 [Vigna radiata var. radiata]
MGRKGWFYSVKKVFFSDSKKEQKHSSHHQQQHHPKPPKLGCFGAYHPDDLEGAPIAVVPSLPPRKDTTPRSLPENEQNNQAFSLVLATAVAAGAAVAAAAEVSRPSTTSRQNVKLNDDMAATTIQTAYRGYLARRSLRGLRGLARLRTLVQGQSVQRQAATTLQCMQTLSRLQSQIRARKVRMSEENQTLNRQLLQKREKELDKLQANQIGEKWDDSSKSKEQVEAQVLNRQIAAMRRQKALAYASTHQQTRKNSSKSATNATFMDPNNPHWGWNWLERWMATRPWEDQNTTYHIGHASAKSGAKNTMSVGEITKLYSLRDQNNDVKTPPENQKPKSPSKRDPRVSLANVTRPKVSSGSWGGEGDSKSMFYKVHENNRRHSIGVSPLNDDEIPSSSSPAFPSHTTPSTQVAKAKPSSKGRSSSFAAQRNTTPEKTASAPLKKRLSFPSSPAGARRYSVSTRPGNVASNKSVANGSSPEEKMRVRR